MRKLTVSQAARLRGVHPETIRVWVRQGKVPDRRPPGTRKIVLLEIDLILPATPTAIAA